MSSTRNRARRPLSPRRILVGNVPGVLSLWQAAPGPGTARDLLAVWAGLQRLAPEPPPPPQAGLEEALEDLVRSHRAALLGHAAGPAFDLGRWREDVGRLDADTEADPSDPEELDGRAWELFRRLDRAALAAWAVSRLGGGEVPVDLGPALQTLRDKVDLFLGLAEEAGEVLAAARADLEEAEPELAETLLPHQRLVEARDLAEAPPEPTVLLRLARRQATTRPADSEGPWSRLPEPPLVMAAQTRAGKGLSTLTFAGQGAGGLTARLVIDQADSRTPLRVNFYAGEVPAVGLAGQPVTLAGCPAVVDAEGNADFPLEGLWAARSAGRPFELRVGADAVLWPLI